MTSRRRTKTKKLIYESDSLAKLLFEQEDLFAEEPAEEEGGDEAADEGGDEAADEGGDEGGEGEEAAADEGEGEEGEGEEEDEKLDVDLEDEVKLSKSVDQDLEALLIDFETDARKSMDISEETPEEVVDESLHLGMLIESEDYEKEIDLDRFTAEVARLVKNYTTLLDMEKMLVSKAREFVATRYGEAAEEELVNTLNSKHDIAIEEPTAPDEVGKDDTPIAVGAGTGASGGAAA